MQTQKATDLLPTGASAAAGNPAATATAEGTQRGRTITKCKHDLSLIPVDFFRGALAVPTSTAFVATILSGVLGGMTLGTGALSAGFGYADEALARTEDFLGTLAKLRGNTTLAIEWHTAALSHVTTFFGLEEAGKRIIGISLPFLATAAISGAVCWGGNKVLKLTKPSKDYSKNAETNAVKIGTVGMFAHLWGKYFFNNGFDSISQIATIALGWTAVGGVTGALTGVAERCGLIDPSPRNTKAISLT